MVFVDRVVTGAFVSGNGVKPDAKEEKPFMNPPEEVKATEAEEPAAEEKPKRRNKRRVN